jgi:L-threonylcarbamoyladenylate synthase
MALPLLASGVRQVSEIAVMTPLSRTIAKRFWPGALTLVVKRSSTFPDFVCAGKATIAVRVPAHNVPRALARALGVPVIGTSANLSGAPSARSAQEAAIQLGKLVDLIIDGGDCTGGIESTIVDVTGAKPVILREGAIREEEIIRSLRNEKKGRLE